MSARGLSVSPRDNGSVNRPSASRPATNADAGPERDAEVFPPELELLFCLERPEPLLAAAAQVDWSAAVALARDHRLEGRLHRALERCGAGDTSSPATASLRSAYEQQAVFAELYLFPQLEAVCAALLDAGVTPTLLKGAALVAGGIVPAGVRPMADIDVLVPRARFANAQAALDRAGYRARVDARTRQRSVTRSYGDAPLHHREHPMSLDLHWHLQGPHHRHPFDPEALQTCELRLPGGARVQRLTDPDLLAHLCLHFWRDRAKGLPGPLGQLWDVHDLSVRLTDEGWERLVGDSPHRGHRGVVAATVALTHLLFAAPLPPRFPQAGRLADDPRLHAFTLRRVLAPRPPHLQMLVVTPDTTSRPYRMATRAISHLRHGDPWPGPEAQPDPEAPLGAVATRRARARHAFHLLRLVGILARHPGRSRAELAIDRWAHDLT